MDEIECTLEPKETYGPLNHGVAHRIDIHGHDSVIKLVDSNKDSEGAALLQNEGEVYEALQSLWGVAIPTLVFNGPISYGREALAITYEGMSLDESYHTLKTTDIAANARKSLSAIHRAGYVHGDIAARNLVVDNFGNVKFIDLGQSHRSSSPLSFEMEMRALDDLSSKFENHT